MRKDSRTLEEKIADRNAKLDALHEKLSSAVDQLVTGNDWLRALAFAARFRSRSAGGAGIFEVREWSWLTIRSAVCRPVIASESSPRS